MFSEYRKNAHANVVTEFEEIALLIETQFEGLTS
jgi:hypothetical protein